MRTRFSLFGLIVFVFITALVAAPQPARPAVPVFSEPALSPDGNEIAFVSGGAIWAVPASGGQAHLLVSYPAAQGRPLYSPDGRYMAFTSTRTGNGDIYVLTLHTGELRRLTWDDAPEQLDAWSHDSQWIYFSSSSHDISGMNDIFRVNVRGGTPMEVTADRYTAEFGAAPAPDGNTLAFSARGVAAGQWWRNGHSHLDESELWLRHEGSPARYERVAGGGKNLWPMWTPDGKVLYFMSDRNGHENIWKLPMGGSPEMVTNFGSGRVLWPAMAANGKQLVFERSFGVWKLDLATREAAEVKIELRGSPAGNSAEHRRFTSDFQDLALSPDGKKLTFTAHGEVFAASAKDGGDAIRVTRTTGRESQIEWAPDNHRIAYISNRDGHDHVFVYDFNSGQELAITSGSTEYSLPSFSPDGKLLAFQRATSDIVLYDFNTKKERVLAAGVFGRPPMFDGRSYDWSPDGRWIAFLSFGVRGFRNVSLAPLADGEAQPISFLANSFADDVSFSHNGQYLLFDTSQRTEEGRVARVDLLPRTPKFREEQFRDLFKDDKTPSKSPDQNEAKPEDARQPAQKDSAKGTDDKTAEKAPPAKTEIVLDGIRNRLTLLPIGLNVDYQRISPDGKWLGMLASSGGQINVYVYSIDELSKDPPVARQLTATAGRKRSLQFAPDSKELYYLDDGRIQHVALEQPAPKPVAVTAEMDVNFDSEKNEVFEEAWRVLRDNFFDPQMRGVNWQAMHDEFEPHIAAAHTPEELRRLLSLMIGELNASHSGTGAPLSERRTATGRLGLRFDRADYEARGKFRVIEVVGLGPSAIAGIKIGESIISIEGALVDRWTNLDALLDYTIDRKITVGVADSAGKERMVSLKPVRSTVEKSLLYRDWVNRNREYVEKASGGKLGYVHMFDMGADSLNQLYVDLDTSNVTRQGVIVDVRNNNGGFVNAYALDVLSRHGYMTMTPRILSQPIPARSQLGQRSLELPTILVTNQHSLSDAEDFTEGYRSLKLGKVVGEPTGGWIIYTGGTELIDGSTVRVPFIRIRAQDGTDMEMHPRPVDVPVSRAIGESYRNTDSQLDVAVRELMNQLRNNPSGQQKPAGQ